MISHLAAEENDARETYRLVRDAGRTAASLAGDIQDEGHRNQLVDRCVEERGGLDIPVNNTAYQMSRKGIADISTEQFDQVSPNLLDYATSKAAILNFTKGPGPGTRPQGHPGQRSRPRAHLDSADPGDHAGGEVDEFGADTPLRRAGQPAELAPAYVVCAEFVFRMGHPHTCVSLGGSRVPIGVPIGRG